MSTPREPYIDSKAMFQPVDVWLEASKKAPSEKDFIERDTILNVDYAVINPKGQALLSAIYAEEEKQPNQPFVVNSYATLKRIASLVDSLPPPGGEITIVFRPFDTPEEASEIVASFKDKDKGYGKYMPALALEFMSRFSNMHSTTIKLIKSEDSEIHVIHMDSVDNPYFNKAPDIVIFQALSENAKINDRKPSVMTSFIPRFPAVGDNNAMSVQTDNVQCSNFASRLSHKVCMGDYDGVIEGSVKIKDEFSELDPWSTAIFDIPLDVLKMGQSKLLRKKIEIDGKHDLNEPLNPRVEKSSFNYISAIYINPTDYIQYFASKNAKRINTYLKEHSADEVLKAVSSYDAGKLTFDRLLNMQKPRTKKHLGPKS